MRRSLEHPLLLYMTIDRGVCLSHFFMCGNKFLSHHIILAHMSVFKPTSMQPPSAGYNTEQMRNDLQTILREVNQLKMTIAQNGGANKTAKPPANPQMKRQDTT